MSMSNITTLRASAAVASLLALSSLPAMAAAPPLQVVPAAAPSAVLKHLPAGHDELTFRGETTRRSWPIYLARGDIERTRTFQLALKSTVALLPDRSTVKLSINGHLLATLPVRSSENFAVLPVAIPPGVLVPGFNSVDVSVVMEHRVDCSVAATYELWTQLDPAQTGFVLPAGPSSGVRSIDDIAGEPLAEDGTTRIALRTTDLGDAAAIGRASLFIEASGSSRELGPARRADRSGRGARPRVRRRDYHGRRPRRRRAKPAHHGTRGRHHLRAKSR